MRCLRSLGFKEAEVPLSLTIQTPLRWQLSMQDGLPNVRMVLLKDIEPMTHLCSTQTTSQPRPVEIDSARASAAFVDPLEEHSVAKSGSEVT